MLPCGNKLHNSGRHSERSEESHTQNTAMVYGMRPFAVLRVTFVTYFRDRTLVFAFVACSVVAFAEFSKREQ